MARITSDLLWNRGQFWTWVLPASTSGVLGSQTYDTISSFCSFEVKTQGFLHTRKHFSNWPASLTSCLFILCSMASKKKGKGSCQKIYLDCSSGYAWSWQEVPKELIVLYPNAWDHSCSLCFCFFLKFGIFFEFGICMTFHGYRSQV